MSVLPIRSSQKGRPETAAESLEREAMRSPACRKDVDPAEASEILIEHVHAIRRGYSPAERQIARNVCGAVLSVSLAMIGLAAVVFHHHVSSVSAATDGIGGNLVAPEADCLPTLAVERIATVTAYCDRARPMADGRRVHVGACAGPRNIPFGTVVIIDGRRYTVEDRTARRFDGRFDIWMPSRAACLQFGKRRLAVEVVSIRNPKSAIRNPKFPEMEADRGRGDDSRRS